MTLRDVLKAVAPFALPDEMDWQKNEVDFRPQSVSRVNICTMCEEETWTRTYPENPLLIPWYGADVYGITPSDEDHTLDVWIKHEEYVRRHLKAWKDGGGHGMDEG